uniref:Lysophospholipid acyltransferase 7 n=1 Tax=Panagrolaimus sp. PS1159 TaxID=55785 RepID=A0AC35G0I3_9BILA
MDNTKSSWRAHYPFFAKIEGDLIYGLLLLFCAGIATFLRKRTSLAFRRQYEGFIGVLITILVSRTLLLYSLVVVCAHLAIYKYVKNPRSLANMSFYGTFTYLAFLRIAHFFGLPKLEFITNAIQLIMTLRVIGLSYEIADTREAKKDTKESKSHKEKRYITEPTPFEAFTYLYSFTGLFTGPYYSYQTYHDALHSEFLTKISVRWMIMKKLRTLSWSLPMLILFYILSPLEMLKSEKVSEYNFFTLILLSSLAFVYLRMRIYTAWMIAESICICSGIGIYPRHCNSSTGHGPRNLAKLKEESGSLDVEYDAETINNLDIPHVECSDGFRSGMRAWNKTVQYWLANFVYKRTNKSWRMPYTMFISAFWHGIHPGYFFSFLTIPLCTFAEDLLFKVVKPHPETKKRPFYFELIWRFIRTKGFELMACGFLLLSATDTIRLWNGVYWWLHFTMIFVAVGSHLVLLSKRKYND